MASHPSSALAACPAGVCGLGKVTRLSWASASPSLKLARRPHVPSMSPGPDALGLRAPFAGESPKNRGSWREKRAGKRCLCSPSWGPRLRVTAGPPASLGQRLKPPLLCFRRKEHLSGGQNEGVKPHTSEPCAPCRAAAKHQRQGPEPSRGPSPQDPDTLGPSTAVGVLESLAIFHRSLIKSVLRPT